LVAWNYVSLVREIKQWHSNGWKIQRIECKSSVGDRVLEIFGKSGRTYQGPVTVDGVEIGMTNTGELDVDENLIWAGLLYWNLLVLDGTAGLLDDLRPLLLRNGTHFDGLK
jgi:hypothetical protein